MRRVHLHGPAPALLEALPDTVVVVDAQARIVYVNPAVRTPLGHDPDDPRGLPLTVFVPQRPSPGKRRPVPTSPSSPWR